MLKLTMEVKLLFVIFLLAFFLRVFGLSEFPYGFHADEARVGWNALSILKTGKDDRGGKFALYYNTFGDFRPTGIFYLTIPGVATFGRNEFAVRFPSSLLGALSVFPLFFFVNLLTKNRKLALFSAFLLTVSPWHITTSRATSEVIVSLFFTLCGFCLFLKGIGEKSKKFLVFSGVIFALSYFFYHSVRILTPLFVFGLIVYFRKRIKEINFTKVTLAIFGLLSLLTFILALNKEARGRFSQVSIFNDLDVQYELSRMPFEEGPGKVFVARLFHNKPFTYARRFVNEYARYFSADFFLVSTKALPARYQTAGVGLLTYVEFILFLIGLVAIAQKKASVLPLILLMLSPIPAALTTEDAPNLHRALYMIGFVTIIESYSLFYFKRFSKLLVLALALNLVFYLHMYFVHSKVHLPLYRNIGAKELALELSKIQGNYDKIILTNIPDDPYPWIAFFTQKDPGVFNKDAIQRQKGTWTSQNYVFTGLRCPSRDAFEKPDVKRLLVVDAEGCATESNLLKRQDVSLIKRILRPDESEVYVLWEKTD